MFNLTLAGLFSTLLETTLLHPQSGWFPWQRDGRTCLPLYFTTQKISVCLRLPNSSRARRCTHLCGFVPFVCKCVSTATAPSLAERSFAHDEIKIGPTSSTSLERTGGEMRGGEGRRVGGGSQREGKEACSKIWEMRSEY